ncbi:MAG: deoxyribonuclease IV [Elusimicrobia bacterium]|nr:deoxyribonuclease IV [Elusimicrobiota bacterium]
MRVGIHCPVSGGYIKAVDFLIDAGGNAMQIFSGNPRSWKKTPINPDRADEFHRYRTAKGISPLVIHASYLLNIASPDRAVRDKSVAGLSQEMERAAALRADYLVLHPGYSPDKAAGIKNTVNSLKKTLKYSGSGPRILLENTAGQKNAVGSDLDGLIPVAEEFEGIAGICIDTAHAFQAGYTMKELSGHEIARYTHLVHINDSRSPRGSGLDRHDHIGKGRIGLKNFRTLIRSKQWKDMPYILETPLARGMDRRNLMAVRSLGIYQSKL